jgi:hypothetical protein
LTEEARRRLVEHGPNELKERSARKPWAICAGSPNYGRRPILQSVSEPRRRSVIRGYRSLRDLGRGRRQHDREKHPRWNASTASIIGPGLIGTSPKYAVGRVRPNTATNAFQFKPFSNNQSFPSGHASQAFAVATAIAENYPVWWVQTLCYGGAGLVGYARIEQNAHLCERRRRRSASRLGGRPCSRASPRCLSAQSRKTELESLRRRRRCSPRVFQVVLIDAVPACNICLSHAAVIRPNNA